jgi:hypothetical protein
MKRALPQRARKHFLQNTSISTATIDRAFKRKDQTPQSPKQRRHTMRNNQLQLRTTQIQMPQPSQQLQRG